MSAVLDALTAARRYHYETETYDREVCSGRSPRSGDAMPVDGRERQLIESNAWYCLKRAHKDTDSRYTKSDIQKAIQVTAPIPYERLKREFASPTQPKGDNHE